MCGPSVVKEEACDKKECCSYELGLLGTKTQSYSCGKDSVGGYGEKGCCTEDNCNSPTPGTCSSSGVSSTKSTLFTSVLTLVMAISNKFV